MRAFFLRDFQADKIESLDLKYPDRLQLKPVKKFKDLSAEENLDKNCEHRYANGDDAPNRDTAKDAKFETRLQGLPGELSLDMATTDKYFGDKSRIKLFERYQWLGHQRQITSTGAENDLKVLFFDVNDVDLNKCIPFGPIRKDNDITAAAAAAAVVQLNSERVARDIDNQSVQSSYADTEYSSFSKFRSRFKTVVCEESAADQYDDLRLLESALRSGVERACFVDDLRHHEEDVLLEVIAQRGLFTNSIGPSDDVSEVSEASQSKRSVSQVPFRTVLQPTMTMEEEDQYTVISGSAQRPLISDDQHGEIASVETSPIMRDSVEIVEDPPVVCPRRVTIADERPATAESCAGKHSVHASTAPSNVKSSPNKTDVVGRVSVVPKKITSQQQRGRTVRLRQASVRFPVPRPKSAPLTALHERELAAKKPIVIDPVVRKRPLKNEYSRIILDQLLDKFSKIKPKQDAAVVEPKALSTTKKGTKDSSSVASVSVDALDMELFLRDRRNDSDESATRGIPITSPRTKYLAGCMKNNMNPRASLVLRKHMSKRLELQHHGFGDEMGKLLAECLVNLPFIESINIADNMLTDVGMGPIILAAVSISSLLELNLSQNEIGPVSAKALFDYLINKSCTLERLILNSADVDDYECERFVEAIKDNTSLVELELSHNKIGSAENLNTVMPNLITGGEALADLLRSAHCNLKSLKLDWNLIRLDGAVDLANSVASNKTLTFLDLSYNSLSTQGGSK